jgi:hypothetical protein
MTGEFHERGSRGLTAVDRGTAHWPELEEAAGRGVMEFLQNIKTEVLATAYDLGEEIMYICIESGPLAPTFVLLLVG